MQAYWWWIIAGFVLLIAELLSGTFYLVVLAVAAFCGAGVAYAGFDFWQAAISAGVVAVAGVLAIERWKKTEPKGPGNNLDIGQSVTLDSWVSEPDGLARVRYRGTLWDAKVIGARAEGSVYYITGSEGGALKVSRNPVT